jgi:hypothetical protein
MCKLKMEALIINDLENALHMDGLKMAPGCASSKNHP